MEIKNPICLEGVEQKLALHKNYICIRNIRIAHGQILLSVHSLLLDWHDPSINDIYNFISTLPFQNSKEKKHHHHPCRYCKKRYIHSCSFLCIYSCIWFPFSPSPNGRFFFLEHNVHPLPINSRWGILENSRIKSIGHHSSLPRPLPQILSSFVDAKFTVFPNVIGCWLASSELWLGSYF